MSLGRMHWWQRLELLSQSGAVPKGQYGATLDLATAPWSVAALPVAQPQAPQQNVAQEMASNPLGLRSLEAAQNQIAAPQAVGEAPEGESLASQLFGFGEPVFNALSWAYRELSSEVLSPITHILPTVWNTDHHRRIGADNSWEALFDGRTWKEIWDQGEKDSWGRGFWRTAWLINRGTSMWDPAKGEGIFETSGKFGTTDAEQRELEKHEMFDTLSGATDFLGVMFLDPLFIGGKYVASMRLLRTTKKSAPVIAKAEDFDEIMDSEPVARFLAWTDGRKPEEIVRHSALKNSPQAGLIADLLSKASMRDKDLIYRVALGDAKAFRELQATAPAIAAQYARMKGQHRLYELETLPLLGRSKAEQKAIRKDLKTVRKWFREEHRTMLKLAETEFIPEGMPFSPRWLPHGDPLVHNTYATVYARLGDERRLFAPTGMVERSLDEIEASMRQFEDFREAGRALRAQLEAKPSKASRRQAKRHLGSRLGELPERTPDGRRIRGQQSLADGIADELGVSRSIVRGIDAQMRAGLPVGVRGSAKQQVARLGGERSGHLERIEDLRSSRKALKQKQQIEPSYQQWWHEQLETYNPAPAAEFAEKMSRQLDLLDDWVAPELTQLNSEGAFFTRVQELADDVAVTPTKTGIFASVDVLPKGGAYSRIAEKKAEFGTKVAMVTQRRVRGALWHAGWASRPVYILNDLREGLARGNTPASISMGSPEAWRTVDAWLKRVRGLPPAVRMEWVRKFMGAADEQTKLQLVEKMEGAVIKHLLRVHGVTDDATIEQIVANTMGSHKAIFGRMADEAKALAEGRSPRAGDARTYNAVRPATLNLDGTALVPGPQLLTQLVNERPLLDVELLDKAFRRDRTVLQSLLPGSKLKDPVMSLATWTGRIWKLSVLARAGYAIRTVSDEVMVAAAALNSWMYLAGAISGAGRLAASQPARIRNVGARIQNRRAVRTRRLPEAELKEVPHQRGTKPVVVGDSLAHGIYDGPTASVTRALTSADQRRLFGIYDDILEMVRTKTNWGVLDPKDPTQELSHLKAWSHALNHQLGKDVVARKFLRGESVEDVLAWTRTHEGRNYLKRMGPLVRANREDWLRGVAGMVDQYTLGDPDLMRLALEGKVTTRILKRVPVSKRMPVHGGQIDHALGAGTLDELLNSVASGFYKIASKLPTDALVRHPVADHLYQAKLRELVAVQEAQGINMRARPDRLYQLEEVARQFVVKEMDRIFKDNLFSSPQTALKFAMPFFGAWRASIARWAVQVGENPWIVARANQGWQGLHKPFDVVDENGVPIEDADEEVFGFDTKAKIVVRLPEKAAKALGALPFVGDDVGEFAPGRMIPLRSFNTVLQGDPWYNPGFGPFVTVPVAEILRDKPEWAEIAGETGVLPFGTRAKWWQHALPTTWQRAIVDQEELDNREYVNTYINILRVEWTRYQRGDRATEPTRKEIQEKAKSLTRLRIWEALLSPVSTQPMFYAKEWETKVPKEWQFLAGKLRDYKSRLGNEQGEAVFLEEFPEAWLYMESVSKNNSGIPANFEAMSKAKKFKHLASVAPDIFDSAVGIQNHDYKSFDAAVYDAQMLMTWREDTGQTYREMRDPTTLVLNAKVRDGWTRYSKMMDYIRAELTRRNLLHIEDPGAEDLKSLKSEYIDYLVETNQDWADAYGAPDPARSRRIRDQAWLVANDQKLLSDPHRTGELKTLRTYLVGRQWFLDQLAARGRAGGAKTLDAKANRDLLKEWNLFREYLGQKSTRFSELWLDRYFANDYLQEAGS